MERRRMSTVVSRASLLVFVMIGLICIVLATPEGRGGVSLVYAQEQGSDAGDVSHASTEGKKAPGDSIEKARDLYYKTEGIVSGPPAPTTVDSTKDYPRYNFESRVLIWIANQQHLYYGSFVLAVLIFCMIIEFMGMVTKDKGLTKRYDRLAYDFIRISLTAYSITAILGGILLFTFLVLYPTSSAISPGFSGQSCISTPCCLSPRAARSTSTTMGGTR